MCEMRPRMFQKRPSMCQKRPAKEEAKPRPDARPLLRCLFLGTRVWRVRGSRDKGEALGSRDKGSRPSLAWRVGK